MPSSEPRLLYRKYFRTQESELKNYEYLSLYFRLQLEVVRSERRVEYMIYDCSLFLSLS